jgi:hypothetical protein
MLGGSEQLVKVNVKNVCMGENAHTRVSGQCRFAKQGLISEKLKCTNFSIHFQALNHVLISFSRGH